MPKSGSILVGIALTAGMLLAACGSSGSSVSSSSTTNAVPTSTTSTTLATIGTFPLTGLPATKADASKLNRPALMVKIDNAPQAWPQSGINQADLVYEEVVEGGITRYMAVFQSQNAPSVGPVRSVRGTDVALAAQTTGLLAYSGGIPTFVSEVRATGIVDVGAMVAGSAYTRDYSRAEPHNLYSSTKALYGAANGRGVPAKPLFQYGSAHLKIPGATIRNKSITIVMSGSTTDTWTYHHSGSDWTKSINGTNVVDTTGAPISATNLIIEFIPYANTGFVDPAGNPVPEGMIVGNGNAEIAIGGYVGAATWAKSSNVSPTSYSYSSGTPVKLRPGRTWVIFAPIGASFTTAQ